MLKRLLILSSLFLVPSLAIGQVVAHPARGGTSSAGGTGDVTGPSGAVAGNIPCLDVTGKILSDCGVAPGALVNQPAQGTFLIAGGQIVWQSAYTFTVSAASYYINGIHYSSLQQNITLTAAHATLNRIDAIGLDSTGTVIKVDGTAAAQPSEPDVDATTQLKLGIVLVNSNTTQPASVVTELVYAEQVGGPTEWNMTSVSTTWALASTNNPRSGTKDIEATALTTTASVTAARSTSAIDPNSFDVLVFYIRSKAAFNGNRSLQVQLQNAGILKGTILTIKSGTFGFDSSLTASYQQVAIPANQFAVPVGTTINQIKLYSAGNGGTLGFYIDDISWQKGTNIQNSNFLTIQQANALYAPLGSGSTLNGILAATGPSTLASGNNSGIAWNWTLATDSVSALKIGETAASSVGTGDNQTLLTINTLATSTAVPLRINCYGATTPSCFRVDDVSGDTTPFSVNSSGAVGINIAPFTNTSYMLDVGSSGANTVVRFTDASGSIGDGSGPFWGSVSNTDFWLGANSTGIMRMAKTGPYANIYRGTAPTTFVATAPYLQIGMGEGAAGSLELIGFGYTNNANNGETGIPPAAIGFVFTTTTGATTGDLVAYTRTGTGSTVPTERLRLTNDNMVKFVGSIPTSTGTPPTITGCSFSAQTGGAVAGTFTSGTTGACTITMTFAATAPTGYVCSAWDMTTAADSPYKQTGGTTTTATFSGTTVTSDVIRFMCMAY